MATKKKARGAMDKKLKPARPKKTVSAKVSVPVTQSCGYLTVSASEMVASRSAPDAAGNTIPSFRFAKIGG